MICSLIMRQCGIRRGSALALAVVFTVAPAFGACEPCNSYAQGIVWGEVTVDTITEASGIASSRRNPGVLWTHNDGSKRKVFAVSTNGFLLASFDVNQAVDDVEDIAVGPGPEPGISYIYLGDIGANGLVPETRK